MFQDFAGTVQLDALAFPRAAVPRPRAIELAAGLGDLLSFSALPSFCNSGEQSENARA